MLDAAPPCVEEDGRKGSSAASAADAASGIEGISGVLDAGSKEKGLCPSEVGDGEGSGWGSAVEATATDAGTGRELTSKGVSELAWAGGRAGS